LKSVWENKKASIAFHVLWPTYLLTTHACFSVARLLVLLPLALDSLGQEW
jgi:hypothetical protein